MTFIKNYKAPPVCKREILRYAGCNSDAGLPFDVCLNEALNVLSYKVCYSIFDVKTNGSECDFGAFKTKSKDLAKNLAGSKKAVIFAATVGAGVDRLITKYSELSPSKAVIMAAVGAERIEALCDTFCKDIEREYKTALKPRFSPGYGDFDLSCQREIFSVISPGKYIGIALNSSMLISPSKSVTAIAGFKGENYEFQ